MEAQISKLVQPHNAIFPLRCLTIDGHEGKVRRMKFRSAFVALFLTSIFGLPPAICYWVVVFNAFLLLLFFIFLFLSFTLRLNGATKRKLCWLAFGNALGVMWNLLLSLTLQSGERYFGEPFSIVFRIFLPFLNSV